MRYVRRSFAALPQRVRAARVASTVFMPPRPPEKRRPHPSPGPAAGRAVGALARPESSGICSITMTLDSWTASPARTGAPPGSRATRQPYAPYRGLFNAEPSPAARMRIRTPTARRFARRRKAAERRASSQGEGPQATGIEVDRRGSEPLARRQGDHAGADRVAAGHRAPVVAPSGRARGGSVRGRPHPRLHRRHHRCAQPRRAGTRRTAAPETMRRLVRAVMAHQGDELQDDATAMFLEWRPQRSPLANLSALAAAGP